MENNDEWNRYKVVDITKPDSQNYDVYPYPITAVVGSGVAIAAIALFMNELANAADPATIIGCLSGFGIGALGAGVSFEQIVKSIAKKTVYENTTKLEAQIAELKAQIAELEKEKAEEKDSKPKRWR